MMVLPALVLSLVGFAALALAMHKHHRDLLGRPPERVRAFLLRCLGWSLLAAALVAAIMGQGVSLGIVLWFGIAIVASLSVTIGLTYSPRPKHAAAKATAQNSRASQPPAKRSHSAPAAEPPVQAAE